MKGDALGRSAGHRKVAAEEPRRVGNELLNIEGDVVILAEDEVHAEQDEVRDHGDTSGVKGTPPRDKLGKQTARQ